MGQRSVVVSHSHSTYSSLSSCFFRRTHGLSSPFTLKVPRRPTCWRPTKPFTTFQRALSCLSSLLYTSLRSRATMAREEEEMRGRITIPNTSILNFLLSWMARKNLSIQSIVLMRLRTLVYLRRNLLRLRLSWVMKLYYIVQKSNNSRLEDRSSIVTIRYILKLH